MTKNEKYYEAIQSFDDWVTVSEWAEKVGEMFPILLQEADDQARNHASKTTGLRELAARISSWLTTKGFPGVEIDETERPRKVKYISEADRKIRIESILESDIEPITRRDKINLDMKDLSEHEKYRIEEIEAISKQFNKYFAINLEVDHVHALFNPQTPGKHHPDNLQLLTKVHNGKKSVNNWQRFNIDEQIEYIEHVIQLQLLLADKMGIKIEQNVFNSLKERIKQIF